MRTGFRAEIAMRSTLFAAMAALAATAASPAFAQNGPDVEETQAVPAKPSPHRVASCQAEAASRKLAEPARSTFLNECLHRPKTGAAQKHPSRRQRLHDCRVQASKIRHLWGLARHKFLSRCVARRAPAAPDAAAVRKSPSPQLPAQPPLPQPTPLGAAPSR